MLYAEHHSYAGVPVPVWTIDGLGDLNLDFEICAISG
jgi:hypothetical protein